MTHGCTDTEYTVQFCIWVFHICTGNTFTQATIRATNSMRRWTYHELNASLNAPRTQRVLWHGGIDVVKYIAAPCTWGFKSSCDLTFESEHVVVGAQYEIKYTAALCASVFHIWIQFARFQFAWAIHCLRRHVFVTNSTNPCHELTTSSCAVA